VHRSCPKYAFHKSGVVIGRIVGYESALVEDNPNLKLPAGSITDYILWDVGDRKDAPQ
jgi:hypothetical protein